MCNNTTTCFCYSNTSKLDNDAENVSLNFINFSTSIAIAILSPLAVVGNALVLAVIWRNPSLRTPSYILLAGLAFTDFGNGLITQPFYVAMELFYLTDPRPKAVAKRPSYLIITAIANGSTTYFTPLSMSIITVMSIERWLHMSRRSLLTVRRISYTLALLCLLVFPFPVYRLLSIFKSTIYIPEINTASLASLLFCLIITSVSYFKVFRIIRSHQLQIHAKFLSQTTAQRAINLAKYKKSVFTILYILAIFYVSYSPLVIALWLFVIFEGKYESVKLPFFDISMVFLFLSSSLNPILYMWRMKDIRSEVTRLVKEIRCKVN